jgi:hypothetical protein
MLPDVFESVFESKGEIQKASRHHRLHVIYYGPWDPLAFSTTDCAAEMLLHR